MKQFKPGDKFIIELGEPAVGGGFSVKGTTKNLHIHQLHNLVQVEEVDVTAIGINKCRYTEGSLIGIDDGLYKPDCLKKHESDDFFNLIHIRHFKYCPYCGREIEVIGKCYLQIKERK